VGRDLITNAGTDITQTGDLTVGESSSLTSLLGNIVLDRAGNDFGGQVVATGVNITLVDKNDLTAQVSAINGGSAHLTAADALTVSGGTSGDLTTSSGEGTTFNTTSVGGHLSTTAHGDITQTGDVRVDGSSTLHAGTGNITLDFTGNDFGGPVSATGHDIVLVDANDLTVSIHAGGFASLSAAGTGVLAVDGSTGDNLTTFSGSDTSFGLTSVGGNLAATAGGNITQSDTLTVTGATSLNAANIELADEGNAFGGPVSATALGNITLADVDSLTVSIDAGGFANLAAAEALVVSGRTGGDLTTSSGMSTTFGPTNVGDHLSTTAHGDITQTGALSVLGTSSLDANGGNISLAGAGNDFRAQVVARGNDITLADVNDLRVTVTAGGFANLTAGESLRVDGSTVGDLTTDSGCCTTFGTTHVGGDLTATAGTNIGQTPTGTLTVAGTSTLNANQDIFVFNDGNDFVGAVSATGRNIILADQNDLTASIDARGFAALFAGEALTVSGSTGSDLITGSGAGTTFGSTRVDGGLFSEAASFTQTDTGVLRVVGPSSLDARGGNITLINAGNDFQSLLEIAGGKTEVRDINALAVQLNTGETYLIANFGGGATGDLTLGGTTGNLTAVSNGGVLAWTNLTATNAILIAGTPVIDGTNAPEGITGPGSTGNVLGLTTEYINRANATGGTINVPGELVLIAGNLPRAPNSSDQPNITAGSAILDIDSLTPNNQVTIKLNGLLRLLADRGVFRFKAGSELPQGVTTEDPRRVQVFIGNVSITATLDELAQRAAQSAAQSSAMASASADARQSFGTDSVTQQIDMGFSGDVGIAPTMGHNVPLEGEIISTPACVTEAKGGQQCKE
jgi:uncharacterized protein DUF5649